MAIGKKVEFPHSYASDRKKKKPTLRLEVGSKAEGETGDVAGC